MHKLFIYFSIFTYVISQCNCITDVFDYDLYENVLDSELCGRQLEEMNAFEFYDASFRIPQGILTGSLSNLGKYHQCLAIKQQWTEDSLIEGKYCMLSVPMDEIIIQLPKLPWPDEVTLTALNTTLVKLQKYKQMRKEVVVMTGNEITRIGDYPMLQDAILNLAVCIPKTCTVGEAVEPYFNNYIVNLTYTEDFCRLAKDKPYAPADYVAIVILSLILLLTILSTTYDVYYTSVKKTDPKEISVILKCCSVYTNMNRLLTFKKNPEALNCLDGLRAISIIWIVIGHTFLNHTSTYVSDGFESTEWVGSLQSLWITSAPISVDTFLTLSGLLLVYTVANKMKPRNLLENLHLFYLNRLLRIFPLLALAVLLQASLFHHVADGVSWHIMAGQVEDCRRLWWTALLHVQNYVARGTICLHPSWYLSVDTQLHILSPLVLFWVLNGRLSAWISLTVAVLVSFTVTTVYCFINNFDPSTTEYSIYYYTNTITRAPPFVIGMLIGYVLFVAKGRKVRLPTFLVVISYLVAFVLSFFCIYYVHPIGQPEWDNQLAINFILSYIRFCWAISLGWLIFACIHGYGGPINWLLSLTIWRFFARISYAMYLFHYPLQLIFLGLRTAPLNLDMWTMISTFITDLTFTVVVSVIACVVVDAPFSILLKNVLQGFARLPQNGKEGIEPAPAVTGTTPSNDKND